MNAEQLLAYYGRIADAPEAIPRLRRFILDLAVRGKLVPQDPNDGSPEKCLATTRKRLKDQAALTKRLRWKPSEPVTSDEVQKDIPAGWLPARVNDTGLYINGLAFKPSDWKQTGLPIIRIQNLTDPSKDFNYADGDFPDELIVRDGDILVSWSATLEAFVWSRGKGVLNQHIFRVLPAEELTTKRFLHLLLRHSIQEMAESEHAHGLVMTHINRGPFLAHVVLIPPLAEQHRIVAKVDELLALCDRLKAARGKREVTRDRLAAASLARLNAPNPDPAVFQDHAAFALDNLTSLTTRADQIKAIHETILELAVRGKLVPQGPNDEPASELLKNIHSGGSPRNKGRKRKGSEDNAIAIPFPCQSGWEWTPVQDLLGNDRAISYGVIKLGDEPQTGGIPTLRCSDVKPGFIDLSGVRKVSEKIEAEYVRTRLYGGEVIINIRGTLGGVAKVPADLKGFNVARKVAVIPISSELLADYVVYVMLSPYFWRELQENLRGIAYKGLNLGSLRDILVPLPPLAEQYRIVAKVDELMALCDRLEASLDHTDATRRRLLDAILHAALEPTKDREQAA